MRGWADLGCFGRIDEQRESRIREVGIVLIEEAFSIFLFFGDRPTPELPLVFHFCLRSCLAKIILSRLLL